MTAPCLLFLLGAAGVGDAFRLSGVLTLPHLTSAGN